MTMSMIELKKTLKQLRLSGALATLETRGRRQLFLPLTTFILAGLEPSSLVHHRAV